MRATTVTTDDGAALHVGVTGKGPDVVVLSGGPGCVHYLEQDDLAPLGTTAWFPEPRGVGRSGGGPHDLARAVADLEVVRRAAGVDAWDVLGHSWGGDLAIRYALDRPASVRSVVAVAGHGLHQDRTWSRAYHAARDSEPVVDVAWDPAVHRCLTESFVEWIHESDLLRRLADCPVPVTVVVAGNDVRPSWPLHQLANVLPRGRLVEVAGVPHDFWSTHPKIWTDVVTKACRGG